MECIILAGGFGTRLQTVVDDVPKCMAPINKTPFLQYVFNYLEEQGCTRVILSLGYKHEHIFQWLATQSRRFTIDYVIEEEPLGTGGGIKLALKRATEENVIIINGDTMFRVAINEMIEFHETKNATTTLALKLMNDFDRYGTVSINESGLIQSFEEKKHQDAGYINGGIYVLNRTSFLNRKLPVKFSFEQDYLEQLVSEKKFYGFCSDTYFIDIGIPSDYHQAQKDFVDF